MQMAITGRNIEVTPALRHYLERKLSRLDRLFGRPTEVQVRLTVDKNRHIVEATFVLDGLLLRGEHASHDMYASVDLVLDKLERQIRKHKTRINRKLRRAGLPEAGGEAEGETDAGQPREGEAGEEEFLPVRVKTFPAKPMTVEEAILQMQLLDHDFFAFRNAETGEFNVVYRRHDGRHGLLQPAD